MQSYVDYVVRSVETLKFMLVWNSLEQQSGGREMKKRHLAKLYASLDPKTQKTIDDLRKQVDQERLFNNEAHALQAKQELDKLVQQNNENRNHFVRAHQRTITARNTLLLLYKKVFFLLLIDSSLFSLTFFQFGSSILLDPIWDVHSQTTKSGLNGRSESFRNILKYICDNIHIASKSDIAALSLARVTGGQELVQLVQNFIDTN